MEKQRDALHVCLACGSTVTLHTSNLVGASLPFETTEYVRRADLARDAMNQQGLDSLLLFHQESMFYLFGYDQLGYWIYQAAVLPADGRGITLICRAGGDYELAQGLPLVDLVTPWVADRDDPVHLTVEALQNLGLLDSNRRLGIELKSHALLPFYYGQLMTELEGRCQLVNASDLVTGLRVKKSAAEVRYVREAARLLDVGLTAAFDVLRPGVRESDVLAATLAAMLRAGGHVPAFFPPASSGPRTMAGTHSGATDRVIQRDEPFYIEPGACYWRYHVVGVQTKWTGLPPREIQSAFDGMVEALQAGIEVIRPGVPTAEVAREINASLKTRGLYKPGRHHGYGTGIAYPPDWLDNLRIKETDSHCLEPNTVFLLLTSHTIETSSVPIMIFVGEPILVTESGAEHLSQLPLSLDLPRPE